MNLLRHAAIGLLSGVLGGLVWGIGARIAMRIVALAAHQATGFSIGGTLGILMLGAIFGAPFGLLFATVRRWLPDAGARTGVLFGGIVLLLMGLPFYLGPLSDEGQESTRLLAAGMFATLFVGFGMVVALVYAWLGRRMFGEVQRRLGALASLTLLGATVTIEAVLVGVMVMGVG